jgi:hypothetical protein
LPTRCSKQLLHCSKKIITHFVTVITAGATTTGSWSVNRSLETLYKLKRRTRKRTNKTPWLYQNFKSWFEILVGMDLHPTVTRSCRCLCAFFIAWLCVSKKIVTIRIRGGIASSLANSYENKSFKL